MLKDLVAPDNSPLGNARSDAIGHRLIVLFQLLFPTSLSRFQFRFDELLTAVLCRGVCCEGSRSSSFCIPAALCATLPFPPVGCPADPHRSWCVLRRRPAAEPSRRPSWPPFALALTGCNWDNACGTSHQLRRSFPSGLVRVLVRFWTRGPFSAHFRVGSGERTELVSRLLSLIDPPSK